MSYLKIYLNTVYSTQLSPHCCLVFCISISFVYYYQVIILTPDNEPFRTVISVIYLITAIVYSKLSTTFISVSNK